MQLMMVTFCLVVGFLNFAYAFHFPLMVGISVAMAYSTERWRSETAPQVQTKQVKKDGKKKRSRKHQKVLRATWSRLERRSSTAA
jgi:hypothetical protein